MAATTVTVQVALLPPAVAVITLEPEATPVTTPAELTVALAVVALDQVISPSTP